MSGSKDGQPQPVEIVLNHDSYFALFWIGLCAVEHWQWDGSFSLLVQAAIFAFQLLALMVAQRACARYARTLISSGGIEAVTVFLNRRFLTWNEIAGVDVRYIFSRPRRFAMGMFNLKTQDQAVAPSVQFDARTLPRIYAAIEDLAPEESEIKNKVRAVASHAGIATEFDWR